jgi:hypothetical protein
MASFWNGSVIGKRADMPARPSGIWSVRQQGNFKKESQWTLTAPSEFSGLVMWLDGADGATVFDATSGGNQVTAGNAVARWQDKSTNALHFTQSTANNRPLYVSGGGLDFDGSNDQMQATNGSNVLAGLTTFSLFVVFNADSFSGDPTLLRFDTQNTTDCFFELGQNTGAQNISYVGESGVVATFRTYTNANNVTLSTAKTYVVDFKKRAALEGVFAVNNTEYYAHTGGLAANDVRSNQTSTIGAYANNLYFNGKIYEVIAYSRNLSANETQAVRGYLMSKWSITP